LQRWIGIGIYRYDAMRWWFYAGDMRLPLGQTLPCNNHNLGTNNWRFLISHFTCVHSYLVGRKNTDKLWACFLHVFIIIFFFWSQSHTRLGLANVKKTVEILPWLWLFWQVHLCLCMSEHHKAQSCWFHSKWPRYVIQYFACLHKYMR